MIVWPVADAEDDHVALIALHILKVFDEERAESIVTEQAGEARVVVADVAPEGLLDQ